MSLNLFGTVLTYAAPSSNYHGETEENRVVIQKISKDSRDYPIVSTESIRNALREILSQSVPCNRSRLHTEEQLAVEYKEFPNPEKYADDFLFGFMVADPKAIKEHKDMPSKRDSVLRVNMAVALTPYRFNAIFHQSPRNGGASPFKNAANTVLLQREVAHTAYQYPFALSQRDCSQKPEWTKALLTGIAELSNVAGGQARSYYDMAPASIVARLTPRLVAGYDTYGFKEQGDFPELRRINSEDLPGDEFWIGGEIVRKMGADEKLNLSSQGVHLFENPQRLMSEITDNFLK